jgi:hypothetical protein
MWIRKRSHKLLIIRHDLDRIYKSKLKTSTLDGKVALTFVNGTTQLEIECVRNIVLPSDVQKRRIEEVIAERKKLSGTDPQQYQRLYTNTWGTNLAYENEFANARLSVVQGENTLKPKTTITFMNKGPVS